VHRAICEKGLKEHGLNNFAKAGCKKGFPELHKAFKMLESGRGASLKDANLDEGLRCMVLLAALGCSFSGDSRRDMHAHGDFESLVHAILSNRTGTVALSFQLSLAAVTAAASSGVGTDEEMVRMVVPMFVFICFCQPSHFMHKLCHHQMDSNLLNHFQMSCKKHTGTDSFAHQAFSKLLCKKDEKPTCFDDIEPMAGRCSELLVLKLNCTLALFQHCSAAHLELKKNLGEELPNSFPLMKWLCHGNREICMQNILKRLGHLCFAKFMFQFRGSKSIAGALTPGKRKEKDAIMEDNICGEQNAGKKGKLINDNDKAACLKPHLQKFATEEDLAGLATKEDLQTAICEVRGRAILDAAGNISLAMAEAIQKAEQKIWEVADHAISKMDRKQHKKDSKKTNKRARKVSKGKSEVDDPSMSTQMMHNCKAFHVWRTFVRKHLGFRIDHFCVQRKLVGWRTNERMHLHKVNSAINLDLQLTESLAKIICKNHQLHV